MSKWWLDSLWGFPIAIVDTGWQHGPKTEIEYLLAEEDRAFFGVDRNQPSSLANAIGSIVTYTGKPPSYIS